MATGLAFAMRSWVLALLLVPTTLADAGGRDVAVLVRRDRPMYERFADRFRRACDCSARIVPLGSSAADAADEVRALRPAAVVAVGRSGLRASVAELPDLPIVHALVVNPWSVLPPGMRDLPGAPLNVDPGESLALLKEIAPRVRTVAVVHDPTLTGPPAAAAARAAKALGLTLDVHPVSRVADVQRAIDSALVKADALLLLPDRTVVRPEILEYLTLRAFERRIPVVGVSERDVRTGALFAVTVDPADIAVETAGLVEQVLAGRTPVPPPRRTSLTISQRTADRLGLELSDSVRRRASKVLR